MEYALGVGLFQTLELPHKNVYLVYFSLDGRQSRGKSPISYVPCSIFACGWVICTAHPQNIFRPFVGASITKSMQFAICSESNDVKEEDGWYRDDAAD